MLQEIEEQPKVLKQLIVEEKEKIYETVSKIIAKYNINKIVLTGCGDSYCEYIVKPAKEYLKDKNKPLVKNQ